MARNPVQFQKGMSWRRSRRSMAAKKAVKRRFGRSAGRRVLSVRNARAASTAIASGGDFTSARRAGRKPRSKQARSFTSPRFR